MKLVELLARELKAWPVVDGVEPNYIVQEGGKELYSTTIRPIYRWPTTWHRAPNDKTEDCGYFDVTTADLAEDWSTAIVTRTDWAAERARIAKPAKKADKDGWIRHRGGKCPVEAGVKVDYRMRDGMLGINERSERLDWGRSDESPKSDIMAYRLHKPAEQGIYADDKDESSEPVQVTYVDSDGPLQWRDRITEIDATTNALTTERAELVQKLASEGFALIGRINGLLKDSAQNHEDMSDWRNWKVGDVVRYEGLPDFHSKYFTIGNLYEIKVVEAGDDCKNIYNPVIFKADDSGGENSWRPKLFKFHSRPSA